MELLYATGSIRPPESDPLRLHTSTLSHLARPLLLRARLPRHGPAPRAAKTHLANHVPDQIAKRSLPSQRVCQVYEPVWDIERACVCVAVTRDAVLRRWGGVVLACELGGAEYGGWQ